MLRTPKKKEKDRPPSAEPDDYDEPEPAPAEDEAQSKRKAELLKIVEEMDKKLQAVEFKLVTPSQINSDDKYFVEADRVYLNLIWLNAEVGPGGGDVAGGADFAPTDNQIDLLKTFEGELASIETDYQKFMKEDLPAFNGSLSENHLSLVAPLNSEAAKQE